MEKFIFKKTNLQWIVDYDYIRSPCHCHEDYCRCTTIERAWVEKVEVHRVIDELYNKHSRNDSNINKYCFERICHAFKIYDKNSYEVETGYGYYGEEVYGVYFNNEEEIFNVYYEVISFDTAIEKIRYCLKLEYGYLIDCAVSANSAIITEVSPYNIRLPQMEYFIKVDKNVIEEYKNRDMPVAVCVKDGDKYRLIDGYHRFVANKEKDSVSVVVLM